MKAVRIATFCLCICIEDKIIFNNIADYGIGSGREQTYTTQFFDGTYDPSLLFDDQVNCGRIMCHPTVKWKLQHLMREWKGKRKVRFVGESDLPIDIRTKICCLKSMVNKPNINNQV